MSHVPGCVQLDLFPAPPSRRHGRTLADVREAERDRLAAQADAAGRPYAHERSPLSWLGEYLEEIAPFRCVPSLYPLTGPESAAYVEFVADGDLASYGVAVPGLPGACLDCGHQLVWHETAGKRHCVRCACPALRRRPFHLPLCDLARRAGIHLPRRTP